MQNTEGWSLEQKPPVSMISKRSHPQGRIGILTAILLGITPLLAAPPGLFAPGPARVWLKMDALQPSASFKMRGVGHLVQRHAQLAGALGRELVVERPGVMVIHQLEGLARVERIEGLEDERVPLAGNDGADIDGGHGVAPLGGEG